MNTDWLAVVKEKFYNAYPEIVEKMAQAQEEIQSFLKENEEEALKMK